MSLILNGNGTITNDSGAAIDFGSENLTTTGTVTGVGSGLTALNASNLASGTVATARLGTGTASSSNFLRGDGSWQEAGGGAWSVKTSGTFSNTASFELTNLTKTTIVHFTAINQTQNSPALRVSTDNGSSYQTNYNQYGAESDNSALSNFSFQGTLSSIFFHGTSAPDAGGFLSGWYMLVQPADTNTKTVVLAQCVGEDAGTTGQQFNTMTGVHLTAGAVNAIKLFHPAATSSLTSGSFVVCELN